METIQITSEDGEQIQFYVVEQTRVNGKDYILVTETEDEEAEAYKKLLPGRFLMIQFL